MKLFIIPFILIMKSIIPYSELRILQEEMQEKVISVYDCRALAQGYKRELIIRGYFISSSSLPTLDISSIQRLFSPNLFLIIDEYSLQPSTVDILPQFSAVFLQRDLYNNRTMFQSRALLCQVHSDTIRDLTSYSILAMQSHYQGELYHTEYFYSPSFIQVSSLFILIYSCILIIPKIYFSLCRMTDPFQKIWLISYSLICLMAVILFFQARGEVKYFGLHHLKPDKSMTYYLLIHLDSLFKAYTMTMLVALANGLYFDYSLDLKESGWYIILFMVLQILFGMDDMLNYFLKKKGSFLGYSLIQMMLELKDLMLFSFIVKMVLFKLRMMEMNLFQELIVETTISPQHQRNIEIKLNYVRKAKGSLTCFMLFLCIFLIICKTGCSVFITGIIVPTIKMIGDLCLLTTVSYIFYPKHLPHKLWLYSITFENEYSVNLHKAITPNEVDDDKLMKYCRVPYLIINPFMKDDQSLYNSIKIGYLN